MRLNRYLSTATGCSRRGADKFIAEGRVRINGQIATLGQPVDEGQEVTLDNKLLSLPDSLTTLMLNKPIDYVVSRNGQGSKTIYELLPTKYHELKPIGRLDKDSSGLLLMSNDGQLAQILSHPSSQKLKVYDIKLNKPLTLKYQQLIDSSGVKLDDGISRLSLTKFGDSGLIYRVRMSEGRNRQIRRTFDAIGYKVVELNRISFGDYTLNNLKQGDYQEL